LRRRRSVLKGIEEIWIEVILNAAVIDEMKEISRHLRRGRLLLETESRKVANDVICFVDRVVFRAVRCEGWCPTQECGTDLEPGILVFVSKKQFVSSSI
jgi:hypothetical protein